MNASGLLYNLTHHWGFARALRLILGLMMAWQSVLTQEWLVLVLALSFAGMALFGIGACNSGACAPRRSSVSTPETEEVEYEEVR
jgi:hypothetical protein